MFSKLEKVNMVMNMVLIPYLIVYTFTDIILSNMYIAVFVLYTLTYVYGVAKQKFSCDYKIGFNIKHMSCEPFKLISESVKWRIYIIALVFFLM
jgi:Ca2+-dependent lipid-binding protein